MTKRHHPVTVCMTLVALLAVSFFLLVQAIRRYDENMYPMHYADTVETVAQEYGVSPSLIYAVIHTESHFRPEVRSRAGAIGLMQITDDTYRWALQRAGKEDTYDSEALLDPDVNIRYGAYILHLLGQEFEKDETLLAAYNAGQGNVHQWLEDPTYSEDGVTLIRVPYTETADYIERVLRTQARYQQIYKIQ